LLAFGGGVTRLAYNRDVNGETGRVWDTGAHFFVGLPLPLFMFTDDHDKPDDGPPARIFFEPYYRYARFDGQSAHEFGIYFKTAAVSWYTD
jgi:hypothetical protein